MLCILGLEIIRIQLADSLSFSVFYKMIIADIGVALRLGAAWDCVCDRDIERGGRVFLSGEIKFIVIALNLETFYFFFIPLWI